MQAILTSQNNQSRKSKLVYTIGPPLLYALLSAIFLWQPLLTGHTFLPTDLVNKHDDVWEQDGSQAKDWTPQNELLSDVPLYYYPYAHYAIERLSSGEFPHWNPYILGGSPFFAAAQGAVLDPVNLVAFASGPQDYWTWGAFLRLTLLGSGTFGFLRALGRGMPGALSGGVVFMLGGFVVVWLNYSVVTTLTWMPLLFWATVRLLQTGRLVWLAAAAAGLGALMIGGHPETQFLAVIAWGLFSLFGLGVVLRERGLAASVRSIGTLVGVGVLGLGLAAVQLFPFLAFLFESSAIAERLSAAPAFNLGDMGLRLAFTFFPNFGGTPIEGNYWIPRAINTNFNDQTTYPGLLALVLAVVGLATWWKRGRHTDPWPIFFAVFGLISLWLAVRAPGSSFVRELPIFNVGHGVRWGETVLLCVSALTAWGVDNILRVRPHTRQARDIAIWFTSAALAASGILLLVYVGIRDGNWDRAWGAVLSHEAVTRMFHPASLTVYLPILFLFGASLIALFKWRALLKPSGAAAALILLLYAEMWSFGSRYNPTTPRASVYPSTGTTDFLRANLGHERFSGLLNTLRPNASMLFQVRDIRGFEDVAFADVVKFLGRFARGASLDRKKRDLELTSTEHRTLSVSSVKYLLTLRKPRVDGSAARYRYVTKHKRVAVYENLEALPRARFCPKSRTARNDKEAYSLLIEDAHNPRQTVVLTSGDESVSTDQSAAAPAEITWLADFPERVKVEVNAQQAGYVVLSDSFAPGWEASVSGVRTVIHKADYMFRAVAVPSGRHIVEFVYRPLVFYWSAGASSLSAAVIFGIALWSLLRRQQLRA